MAPVAMHHARGMSKLLYGLNVWIFRGQFVLTALEEKMLHDFCIFAILIYLKAWITASKAACASQNDLDLLKCLLHNSDINPKVSKAVGKKLGNHLWYHRGAVIAQL